VEAVPADPARAGDVARVLERFGGGDCPHHEQESVAVRLKGGDSSLADVVRALDAEHIEVAHLQLHAPTLDDVFLAKTGRTLEGSGEDEDEEPEQEHAGTPAAASA
jgi:ABC-2 type transport system ATP-binding protein